MFGIDDIALGLLGGAAINSAASVVGGYMGASENAAINQANMKYNAMAQVNAQQFNQAAQLEAQRFNAEQALLNRQFQEKMSNSSYQRAMSDLEKANLNPMLVISNGGASVPSGSAASSSAASVSPSHAPSPLDVGGSISKGLAGVGEAVNSAVNGYIGLKNLENNQKLVASQVQQNQANAALKTIEAQKVAKESDSIDPQIVKENTRFGNGLIGQVGRGVRELAQGLGFRGPMDTRLKDLPDSTLGNSAKEASKAAEKALDSAREAFKRISRPSSRSSRYLSNGVLKRSRFLQSGR